MKLGPSIAGVAALIGDPARANMLQALMQGAALTATELALEAGVTKQTASSHLAKLSEARLVAVQKGGRHRYYRLHDAEVAWLLESLMGVADRAGFGRARPGPKEPALRRARVCYDHLAGDMGVEVFDAMLARGWLSGGEGALAVTEPGAEALARMGIDVGALQGGSRAVCRPCLDWSARRHHLAGALGAALLDRIFALGWARRAADSRVVTFTLAGEAALRQSLMASVG